MTEHNYTMTAEMIDNYVSWLTEEEKSENTISKYKRDLTAFLFFISEQNDKTAFVNKSQAIKYKEYLLTKNAVSSINSILVAINGFFKYMGWNSCRLKLLKHQRQAFREQEKELTVKEYSRLVKTAGRKGNERLKLILETICSTGIRVSELPFITVNAAKNGKAEIRCKGKHRIICLPKKLCQMLSSYAKSKKISSGYIFKPT